MEDIKIFNRIINLNSLKPSKETNSAFSDLVKYCKENRAIHLKKYQINELRKLSSVAEYEMELYWAKRIVLSKEPTQEIKQFWYYTNYEQLVDLEYSNVRYVYYKNIETVLFVGGGPLPLTAILLCEKYDIKSTILEKDKLSYEISLALIEKLKLGNKVKVINIAAEKYSDYDKFNLVYLASLVGNSAPNKNKIINTIYTSIQKDCLLLCRSSHGTRTLLYASISKTLLKKIRPVLEVRPYNSIINSFFILQKT
jgi:nicotianamine synthase